MSQGFLTLVWLLLGAAVGGTVVGMVLRRRGGAGPAAVPPPPPPPAPVPVAPLERTAIPEPGAPAHGDLMVAEPAALPVDVRAAAPVASPPDVPVVPTLHTRPHPTDPSMIGDRVLVQLGGLRALTRDVAPAPLRDDDGARLVDAVAAVADGGVLVLPGPARTVLQHALHELHGRLGDVSVLGVPAPRRGAAGDRGRAPLRSLAADPTLLAREGRAVVIVEDAEVHLRRGLDSATLTMLRDAAPSSVMLLVVGACEHDAASLDDAGRWLDGLVLRVGGPRIAAAGAHDPELDVPLMDAVQRAPLLADLAEAAAYARAAGRLPDVPLAVVARVAALIAGASADEPADDHQLGAAIAADTAEPPLLRFDMLDRAGLPTTLRAPAVLVARCVADPGVLTAELLEVLLEDADDVERLLVARRLTASERPGLALPVLDALVAHDDTALASEARLVRGVARDRLGLATAADDYHAVAIGGHGTLSAHGAFLLGGILETSDDLEPSRAAYRSAMAAGDATHSAMAAFNLAWLEERQGRTDVALDAYRAVAEGDHRDAAPMAALNLATLLERGKRYAESESWYRVAVESQHPDASPMAALSLGLMLERRQRPREARALFRQAAASGHAEAARVALRRLGAPRR